MATAGLGVALGISGFLVYRAGSAKLEALMQDANAGRPYNAANDNYKTMGDWGIGLMVGGGVALAAGAVLYLLNREGPRGSDDTSVSVGYLSDQGAMLQVRSRFQ